MEQTYAEMPKKWYEDVEINSFITTTTPIALLLLNIGVLRLDALPINIAAASMYAISALTDYYSTLKCFKANDRAKDVGLGSLGSETNEAVADIKTADAFIHSRRPLVGDIVHITISTFIPPVGVG